MWLTCAQLLHMASFQPWNLLTTHEHYGHNGRFAFVALMVSHAVINLLVALAVRHLCK